MSTIQKQLGSILFCVCVIVFSGGLTQAQDDMLNEKITYDIKKLGIDAGNAVLEYKGAATIDGRQAVLVVVTSEGFKFYDQEKIYLDPESFFPIRIERDLDIFGKEECIIEYYNEHKGEVRIVKTAKGETTEQIVERAEGGRFDNIYGFIYRYRRRGQFTKGEKFSLHLPLRDVTFELQEKVWVKVAGKKYDAYFMESVPQKYKVLFDSGPQKRPLMISGAIGFGRTSMVIKDDTP